MIECRQALGSLEIRRECRIVDKSTADKGGIS